jgi:protein TonB
VIGIHAALALALLHLSGTVDLSDPQDVLSTFDVIDVPPPVELVPPPPPPPARTEQERAKRPEGGSALNLRSEATPLVAPQPKIEIPVPSPVATSETPAQGTAATQGAAAIAGPGTGSGGSGTGSGGGSGAGNGGGGDGLAAIRTRMATQPLRGKDFPRSVLDSWPPGRWAQMRFRVDAYGTIIQCIMDRGTGDSSIDAQICAVARQRLRYRPALDRNGRRVADWAGYGQEPPR